MTHNQENDGSHSGLTDGAKKVDETNLADTSAQSWHDSVDDLSVSDAEGNDDVENSDLDNEPVPVDTSATDLSNQLETDFEVHDETDGNEADHNEAGDDDTDDETGDDGGSQKASRSSGVLKGILWGSAFTVTATVSALLGAVIAFTVPLAEALSPEEDVPTSMVDLWRKGIRHQVVSPVNILVMGIDQTSSNDRGALTSPSVADSETDGNSEAQHSETKEDSPTALDAESDKFLGRSDTMLLLQVHPEDNTVNVLSIPRDTQVEFPGRRGVTKINHANLIGGPRLAAKVVSHNLNGVSVDRYVRVNTAAFRELVDALGGVEVVVPKPMKYTDQTQGLYIDLKEGRQLLTGEEAEQFARFRSDANGDIGRVQRQQQLIRALRDRVMTPTIVPRLPNILQLLREHIDTNLTPEELLSLLNFALDLDREQLRMVMLPGQFSQANEYLASYWLMDTEAVNRVMEDYFQVRPKNLAAQLRIGRQDATETDLKALRIVIQNASGDPRATQQLTRVLLKEEFTRVYRSLSWTTSDQENVQPNTQIIVQSGDLNGAKLVEQSLGMGTIIPASIGDIHSDITIRIGEDWPLFREEQLQAE